VHALFKNRKYPEIKRGNAYANAKMQLLMHRQSSNRRYTSVNVAAVTCWCKVTIFLMAFKTQLHLLH